MNENISKRESILREAINIVCSDRNLQYGEPEDNFSIIGELWSVYLNAKRVAPTDRIELTAKDASDMLILFKVARSVTATTPKRDTYVDIAGYAACAGAFINEADEEADEKPTLTTAEKSIAIETWCENKRVKCRGCPLEHRPTCVAYVPGEESEKIVEENYDMLFGGKK